jgi:hypothetical protein
VKRIRILALLTAWFVCVPGFSATLSMDEIEVHVGMLTIGDWTTYDGLSAPIGLLGASTQLALDSLPDPWVLGFGLDLFGTRYEWDSTDHRAFLSEVEGMSFFTVGMLVSPKFGVRFRIGEAVALGAFAGLDLLIRFPLDPFSKDTTLVGDRLPALVYFLAGRLLYPEMSGWLTWQAAKDVELALAVRTLWPIYRLWSPEVSNFFDQFILAGTLGMTIKLGKTVTIGKKAEETPAAESTGETPAPETSPQTESAAP